MRPLVILFVKNPVPGEVKTRLAATIGTPAAVALYHQLLDRIQSVVTQGEWDTQIWYGNDIPEIDRWSEAGFPRHKQQGADLGARMHHAFTEAFAAGYQRIILIGSDIPDITPALLEEGFVMLKKQDVLWGPTHDGGFYAIGLRKPQPHVLLHLRWSHPHVLRDSIARAESSKLSYALMPTLSDIDTEEDMHHWQAN